MFFFQSGFSIFYNSSSLTLRYFTHNEIGNYQSMSYIFGLLLQFFFRTFPVYSYSVFLHFQSMVTVFSYIFRSLITVFFPHFRSMVQRFRTFPVIDYSASVHRTTFADSVMCGLP